MNYYGYSSSKINTRNVLGIRTREENSGGKPDAATLTNQSQQQIWLWSRDHEQNQTTPARKQTTCEKTRIWPPGGSKRLNKLRSSVLEILNMMNLVFCSNYRLCKVFRLGWKFLLLPSFSFLLILLTYIYFILIFWMSSSVYFPFIITLYLFLLINFKLCKLYILNYKNVFLLLLVFNLSDFFTYEDFKYFFKFLTNYFTSKHQMFPPPPSKCPPLSHPGPYMTTSIPRTPTSSVPGDLMTGSLTLQSRERWQVGRPFVVSVYNLT